MNSISINYTLIWELDFNRDNDDRTIERLGAKLTPTKSINDLEFQVYKIEIQTFEELEVLLKNVDKEKIGVYSAIISFDPPTIYIDNFN